MIRNLQSKPSGNLILLDWEQDSSDPDGYVYIVGKKIVSHTMDGSVTHAQFTAVSTDPTEYGVSEIRLEKVTVPSKDPVPPPTPPPPVPTGTGWWKSNATKAKLDPNSDKIMAAFPQYAIVHPNVAISSWAVASAYADSGDPEYSVPQTKGGTLDAKVRIPLGTKPDPSGDGHLFVIDQERNRQHDMWQAVYDSGTGRIKSCSSGASFAPDSYTENPKPNWSGNAASFPLNRGLITPEDLMAGTIMHSLVFAMPGIGAGAPRYPATHNVGNGGPDHPVEGTWFRLDPAFAIPTKWPEWQKMIAECLQDYGMFLRDGSGSLLLYGENTINRGGAKAWEGSGIDGKSNLYFSGDFPWTKLQVLQPPAKS